MDRLIPFTPRSIRHAPKAVSAVCEHTLDMLQSIFMQVLSPFPEALQSVSDAVAAFGNAAGESAA